MSVLARFSQQLATLIPDVGKGGFPEKLVATIRSVVPVDDATIVVYPDTDLPVLEYFEVPEEAGQSTLGVFLQGAFLLDPFYLAAAEERRFGLFRLRDLAPTGFRESEYYRSWYRSCGYQDECGFLLPFGEEGFINIALGKTGARASFTQRQLDTLSAVYPVIETLCQQHWTPDTSEPAGVNLRAQLHDALQGFGSSLLTEREAQVINLVLHGHSTKTMAEKLSISVETVKLHRKHAYAKLEVSSQAELFYLFLDALMSANGYSGGDTLVSYMQAPAREASARARERSA
jgi:DNA-binding CsgD family transcriptional regulator